MDKISCLIALAKKPTLSRGEKLKKGMESKANLLMRKAQLIL
jgi:hypothetical protein